MPCYEQYNHHYTGFMHGSKVAMVHPEGGEEAVAQMIKDNKLSMSHGMPLPYFVPLTSCNFTGVWLNRSNGISVDVVESAAASAQAPTQQQQQLAVCLHYLTQLLRASAPLVSALVLLFVSCITYITSQHITSPCITSRRCVLLFSPPCN